MNFILLFLWRSVSYAVHITGTAAYGLAIGYQIFNNDLNDPRSTYIGDFKYLTYWNLLFQFGFHFSSLMCDFRSQVNRSFYELLDAFFDCVTFPFSVFVCLTFWALNFMDERNVRNPNRENRFPEWYNQIVHTLIVPLNILEMIVVYHEEPHWGKAIVVIITLYVLYFSLIIFFGTFTDLWIYPFLANLDWRQRFTFAVICGLNLIFYFFGFVYINRFLWTENKIQTFRQLFREKKVKKL